MVGDGRVVLNRLVLEQTAASRVQFFGRAREVG